MCVQVCYKSSVEPSLSSRRRAVRCGMCAICHSRHRFHLVVHQEQVNQPHIYMSLARTHPFGGPRRAALERRPMQRREKNGERPVCSLGAAAHPASILDQFHMHTSLKLAPHVFVIVCLLHVNMSFREQNTIALHCVVLGPKTMKQWWR